MKCTRAGGWKSGHCQLWHFCFLRLLYRMTLRKSLFPFCGWLSVISRTSLDFFENIMNCHITYGWRILRICAGFNEVTSLSVLLPVEAGWCVEAWRVRLWLYFQKHTCAQRFPVEIKNEPAVQRGVWGVGPGASSLLFVQGECKRTGDEKRLYKKTNGGQDDVFSSFKSSVVHSSY